MPCICLVLAMDMAANQSDSANSDAKPNKRRRKNSMVWDHFTIETVSGDCMRACCKLCKKTFAYMSGSKMSGTSHLKRHITLGICPFSQHSKQDNNLLAPCTTVPKAAFTNGTSMPRKRRVANGVAKAHLDVNNCSYELAKMIIQHDYPLHMVEHSGFVSFARMLQPKFDIPSFPVMEEQVMNIYSRERQMILDLLSRSSGRVNLTVDLQTANQNTAYILLTGHFVDHDWKLQKRILKVVILDFSDSDREFCNGITGCLTDWCFENKLFSCTLECSHANERIREHLRSLLSIKNSLILNGQLLINSCYARLLRNLAQNAIGSIKEIVEKVRHSVKYVKASKINEDRFTKLKQQLQVPSTKSLIIDDLAKWNTTYQMLTASCELKEVFSCLDTSDPNYKLHLSMEDWSKVETLCTYLKTFYDAASILASPAYPTANLFFHEAWKIHLELSNGATSQDCFVWTLTRPLHEIFSKYWESCNIALAVAVVLDPRFKMKLVEFSFCRIYEDAEAWIKFVDECLHELYFAYVVESLPAPTFLESSIDPLVKSEIPQEDVLLPNGDTFADFDIYISDIISGQHLKSELDQYLEESLLPRVQDFDVLGWWKANRSRYPTLAKLAADVLSIPLSTVSPESVFDTREKVMDNNLSSLSPTTLQALTCLKDWLQHDTFEIPATPPIKTEF